MAEHDIQSTAAATFGKGVDFGKTANDYARHRAGFPPEFFDRLVAMDLLGRGRRALDLGTGTGTLARGMALAGCDVTGLDRSSGMVEQATRLDKEAGVAIRYVVGEAEATGLPDAAFAVVTAGQCWHWFDRARTAAEARRLLEVGGALIIAHFDWIPLPGNVAYATERLIEKHNPAWKLGGGVGIHPRWVTDMALAGFRHLETFSFDLDAPYSHEAWRGRIRASAGIGAALAPEAVERFDREHAAMLAERFPADPLKVLHRVFAAIGRRPRG